MGRGGGNGRRISTQGRGNTSIAQGSTSTISPDHEPASSRLEFGLGNVSSNAAAAAADDEYTSESSQRVVPRSKTAQQNGSNITQSAGSLHKTFLIPLATVFNVQNVPTVIRDILEGMFEGAWTTWTKVPQENRDLMWVQFQLKYQWDPKDEAQVKENWNGILAVRFRDVIRDARADAIKLAGENGVIVGDDWSVLKPYHPEWIDEGNWCKMIDKVWNTERWKLKSAKGKANRATKVEGKMAGHSGGSRSMIHTQVYMEKQKGGPVSFVEVYESYFTKKASKSSSGSREFTNPKAEIVRDEYHQLLEEKFGTNTADHPTQIVPTLWEKACGGMKKGKLFGATRDMLVMVEGNCSRYASYRAGPSNEEVEILKDEVKRQKREVEETKKQAEIAEREADMLKTQVAQMQDREKTRELEITSLQEREKTREMQLKSLEDQMKVFTMFMQGKIPPSN